MDGKGNLRDYAGKKQRRNYAKKKITGMQPHRNATFKNKQKKTGEML